MGKEKIQCSHPTAIDAGDNLKCATCGTHLAWPSAGEDSSKFKTPKEWDAVNKPKHYNSHPSGVQCIEITRHMNFNCGNAVKYIWRADLKADAIEDLEKAKWYLEDEIAKRKGVKRET